MLFEELAQSFPSEVVEPYGEVLVIPGKAFKQEWRSQLESEGVQIYSNAFRGQVCFFLRKKGSLPQRSNDAMPHQPSQPEWTPELVEKLKQLRSQGLGHRAIAKQLNLKEHKVYRKLKQLGLIAVGKKQKANPVSVPTVGTVDKPTDMLEELIASLNLLYPKHKLACKVLLQNANMFMEEDAENEREG